MTVVSGVQPGRPFEAYEDSFPSGLEGVVGVTLYDINGLVVQARTTAHITEVAPIDGISRYSYQGEAAPTEQGSYLLVWDDGSGRSTSDVLYVSFSASPPGPVGPCGGASWINGDDVAACVTFDYGSNPAVFDSVATEAGEALFEISGQQFPGICSTFVRPCRLNCPCWGAGPISYGLGPFWWNGGTYGVGGGWAWYNENGDTFGCKPMSMVNLAGYPVRNVTQVLLDGVELPEIDPDTGAPNWRLDKGRYLVRMDSPPVSPSTVATPRFWPGCQNMSLNPDQPGTFEISYEFGQYVPELGKRAAIELAIQLYLACGNRPECVLPAGVTKIERQGITIERGLLANWADGSKAVGLVAVDLFLQAYNQGMRRGRRSAVWSPDLQHMARRVGT